MGQAYTYPPRSLRNPSVMGYKARTHIPNDWIVKDGDGNVHSLLAFGPVRGPCRVPLLHTAVEAVRTPIPFMCLSRSCAFPVCPQVVSHLLLADVSPERHLTHTVQNDGPPIHAQRQVVSAPETRA